MKKFLITTLVLAISILPLSNSFSAPIQNRGMVTTFGIPSGGGSSGGGQVDAVIGGTNVNVTGTATNPVVNLDSSITVTAVNNVTLTASGSSANFLNESGAYSIPAGSGQVDSVTGGTNVNVTGTVADPVVNLDAAITGTSVNGVTLSSAGAATDFLNETGSYTAISSAPVDSVFGRTGAVISAPSDYDASQVDNDSLVTGVFVSNALNTLNTALDTLVDSVNTGANITVNNADPQNPIINLDAAITGTSVNGVTLTAIGITTNFLNETGGYSVPPSTGGTVTSVSGGTNTNVTGTATDPIVNLDTAITGTSVNGVTLSTSGATSSYLDETGNYSVPIGSGEVDSVIAGTNINITGIAADPIINLDATVTLTSLEGTATFGGSGAALRSVSTDPGIEIRETDAALDNKSWDTLALSEQLNFRAVNDANSAANSYMEIQRTGIVIDSVTFPGTTVTISGTATATSFNGVALTTGGVATNFLNETGAYSAPPASASPGGVDTNIQFNDGGAFGGSSDFVFTGINFGVQIAAPTATVHVVNAVVSGLGAWVSRVSAADSGWSGIAFDGSGVFVAVANSDVMRSTDGGATWTTQSPSQSNNWRSVAFGSGLFVAVAASGTNRVMTSPDGISWTNRSEPVDNFWKDITYSVSLGLFVAVGDIVANNQVITSSDGITWTARTASETALWTSVIFAEDQGLFVAVNTDGTDRVMTSPDGITWTPRSSAADALALGKVGYGNSIFVAFPTNSSASYATSPDGITWTLRATTSHSYTDVAFGDGIFLVIADNGADRSITSTDGINWSIVSTTVDNDWQSLAFGNNTFVAVSSTGTGDRAQTISTSAANTEVLLVQDSASADLFAVFEDGTITAVAINGALLSSAGVATNFLDETGNYSVPVGTPGGVDTQIQYNNAGVFDGIPGITTDGTQLLFADNIVSGFGNANSLNIYHTGTIGVIDNSVGELRIENFGGANGDILISNGSIANKIINRLGTSTSATSFHVRDNLNTDLLIVGGNGKVGIGKNTNINALLQVTGNLNVPLTGDLSTTSGNPILSGFGSSFLSELEPGDAVLVGAEVFSILSITNDSLATLDSAAAQTVSNVTGFKDPDDLFTVTNGDDKPLIKTDSQGRVVIGAASPNASSILELTSTTRGFLKPRLTTFERTLIPTPPAGLEIYNTTENEPEFYNGASWATTGSSAVGGLNTQLQYNNNGVFGGTTGFTFVGSNLVAADGNYIFLGGSSNEMAIGFDVGFGGFIQVGSGPLSLIAASGSDGIELEALGNNNIVNKLGTTTTTSSFQVVNGAQSPVLTVFGDGVINATGAITAESFNGVALTTGGIATNYLDQTGNYSFPVGLTETLAETLVNGNVTGGTDLAVSSGDSINMISGSDIQFAGGVGNNFIRGDVASSGRLGFFTDNIERMNISLAGIVDISGALTAGSIGAFGSTNQLQFNNSGVLDGTPGVTFVSSSLKLDSGINLSLGDNEELQIEFDGTNSSIFSSGGELQFTQQASANMIFSNLGFNNDILFFTGSPTSSSSVKIKNSSGTDLAVFRGDGDVSIPGGNFTVDSPETTQNAFDVNANFLTTGYAGQFYSDSSDVNSRRILSIVNDNIAAIGAIPLYVRQESTADIVNILDGATEVFTILDGGRVLIGAPPSPQAKVHIYENNANTNSGLLIEQFGEGDAIAQFLISGIQRWVVGVDNDDGDKFKFSATADLGINTLLTIDTAGNTDIAGIVTGQGGILAGPKTNAQILSISSPAAGLMVYSTDDQISYQYDSSRSRWLSCNTTTFQYGSDGNTDNQIIRFNNLAASGSGPLMPRNGTIISVTGFQEGGNATKGYEVHEDGINIFAFNLIASEFISNTVNVDFSAATNLTVFVVALDNAATDPTASVTVRWRL